MFRIASACTSDSANSAISTAFGSSSVPDDRDHPVEVEVGDEQPLEHLEPRVDPLQPEPRPPQQHLAPVVEERPQHLLQRRDLRRAPVDQHVHVHREAGLEVARPEQHLHQHRRVDGPRPRLQHDAHVLGALVAHVGEQRHLLGVDELGEPLDQLALLHLVGDLGDHDLPGARARGPRPPSAPAAGTTPRPVR